MMLAQTISNEKIPDCKGQPILVVDGDAHHRAYHSMILQRFEYRVSIAATAEEALQMIDDAAPALVLTGLDLPGMSGHDLFLRLRAMPPTAALPVIAVTANVQPGTEAWCLRAGFAALLTAPVKAEALYGAVRTALAPVTRKSPRVHARMPVTIDDKPLDCVEGECASVISEHGMYIRTLHPHAPNARVAIKLDLAGRTIAAEAIVLYCHRFGEGPFGEPGMGIKFASITPRDQEHLRQFLRDHRPS